MTGHALDEMPALKRPGPPCSVGTAAAADPALWPAVERARTRGAAWSAIARRLREEGVDVGAYMLRRHANQECACARQ